MFKQLASQRVQHDSGYIVQVADRNSVEYLEPNLRVAVAVDFGVRVNVYGDSLLAYDDLQNPVPLSDEKRKQVLAGIVSGLSAMGVEAVIC